MLFLETSALSESSGWVSPAVFLSPSIFLKDFGDVCPFSLYLFETFNSFSNFFTCIWIDITSCHCAYSYKAYQQTNSLKKWSQYYQTYKINPYKIFISPPLRSSIGSCFLSSKMLNKRSSLIGSSRFFDISNFKEIIKYDFKHIFHNYWNSLKAAVLIKNFT